MCYFDQQRWACGYWKWGDFRLHCNKEYRTGETCGLKLVYDTRLLPGRCKLCELVESKIGKIQRMEASTERWREEGNKRRATIEKAEIDMASIRCEIGSILDAHKNVIMSVDGGGGGGGISVGALMAVAAPQPTLHSPVFSAEHPDDKYSEDKGLIRSGIGAMRIPIRPIRAEPSLAPSLTLPDPVEGPRLSTYYCGPLTASPTTPAPKALGAIVQREKRLNDMLPSSSPSPILKTATTGTMMGPCLLCRKRGMDCDERKPCDNCVKSNTLCIYPRGKFSSRPQEPAGLPIPVNPSRAAPDKDIEDKIVSTASKVKASTLEDWVDNGSTATATSAKEQHCFEDSDTPRYCTINPLQSRDKLAEPNRDAGDHTHAALAPSSTVNFLKATFISSEDFDTDSLSGSETETSSLSSDSATYDIVEARPRALLMRILQDNSRHILKLLLEEVRRHCFLRPPLFTACLGGGDTKGPSPTNQKNSAPVNSATKSQGTQKRKRRPGRDPAGSDNDEEGNDRPPSRPKVRPQDNTPSPAKFACPFYQNDPLKYRSQRSCLGPGWPSVHRVKEHIYRRHALPIHCSRCRVVFNTSADLAAHMRVSKDDICELNVGEPVEGLTPDQEKAMRCRKHSKLSEEEKWRELYMLLFPDCDANDVPEPYHPESVSMQELFRYRRYVETEAAHRVRARLNGSDPILGDHDLPESLREELLKQLPKLVRDIQLDLFRSYKAARENKCLVEINETAGSGGTASTEVSCSTPSQSHRISAPIPPPTLEPEGITETSTTFDCPEIPSPAVGMDGLTQPNGLWTDPLSGEVGDIFYNMGWNELLASTAFSDVADFAADFAALLPPADCVGSGIHLTGPSSADR